MSSTSIDDTFAAEFELTENVEKALTELEALKRAQAQFLTSLHERIAELQAQRKNANIAEWLVISGQIGLIQAINHDFERITAKALPSESAEARANE